MLITTSVKADDAFTADPRTRSADMVLESASRLLTFTPTMPFIIVTHLGSWSFYRQMKIGKAGADRPETPDWGPHGVKWPQYGSKRPYM